MKQVQKGFTLIELMIVIAIIGILAAIAIPAYSDYITRSKWADTVSSVASIKAAIGECLDNNNSVVAECDTLDELEEYGTPDDAAGVDDTKYGAAISVVANTAAIRMDANTAAVAELASCSYDLTPQPGATVTQWIPVVQAGGTDCQKYIKGAS